ncbi:hypothetical protein ACJJTC_006017 [Scirpophaga incertulas]
MESSIKKIAPNGSEQDIKDFYGEVERLLKITKNHEVNLVMGDMNVKVGQGEVQNTVGKFGLGSRNERGDTLLQFCQENELSDHNPVVANLRCVFKNIKNKSENSRVNIRKIHDPNIRPIVPT